MTSKYLNLGCGSRFHPAWTNVNFTKSDEVVIAANLAEGIPFPDQSYDVVYHSHLLEHFSKQAAPDFLKECYRVLRPNGVIRVAVPDMENIARNYLLALDRARSGNTEWAANYDWLLLEMYDQTVRNHSGGEMAAYLFDEHLSNEKFVIESCGVEAKRLIEFGRQSKIPADSSSLGQRVSWLRRAYRLIRNPKRRRDAFLKFILKDEFDALQVGRFRKGGEVHQWMYDSYSLGRLLSDCGFIKIIKRSAVASCIPDWTSYNLDTEPDGSVYKPDSLFIEAVKG